MIRNIPRCIGSRRGQLLLELIVSIGVIVAVLAVVGQVIVASLQANKGSSERNDAAGFSQEVFEAVRGASTENWINLYNLTHSTGTTYYPQLVSGKWTINTTGTQSIAAAGATYTRSFYAQHACRDTTSSTKPITGITDQNGSSTTACTASGGTPDPSTEKVTVTVLSPTGNTLANFDYITRWRNQVCAQTGWTSTSSGVGSCPSSAYGSSSQITTGGSLQLCLGGC